MPSLGANPPNVDQEKEDRDGCVWVAGPYYRFGETGG